MKMDSNTIIRSTSLRTIFGLLPVFYRPKKCHQCLHIDVIEEKKKRKLGFSSLHGTFSSNTVTDWITMFFCSHGEWYDFMFHVICLVVIQHSAIWYFCIIWSYTQAPVNQEETEQPCQLSIVCWYSHWQKLPSLKQTVIYHNK